MRAFPTVFAMMALAIIASSPAEAACWIWKPCAKSLEYGGGGQTPAPGSDAPLPELPSSASKSPTKTPSTSNASTTTPKAQ